MIQRVYEQAKRVVRIERVIIATDDKRIFDHCLSFDADVMMTSEYHKNGTERIAEVISSIKEQYDAVINIQGDEPFIKLEQLNLLCDIIENKDTDIASLSKEIEDVADVESPNTVKVVMNDKGRAIYFSRHAIPYNRNNNNRVVWFKHIGLYAYKTKILKEIVDLPESKLEVAESLEQLRWLEAGYTINMGITTYDSHGIDTPEDLVKAIKGL
jgi:3-deoxy-manno-octulosonate cytidylyltransferase (CMP-KDO synthetase)